MSSYSRIHWVCFSPDESLLYAFTANPSAIHHPLTDNREAQTGGPNVAPSGSEVKGGNSTKEKVIALQLTVIPRDAILRFIVSRPDSWFQQLATSSACSVRLCRWSGTLEPGFPSSSVNLYRGLATVTRIARPLASGIRLSDIPSSHLFQELMSADSPGYFSEKTQCLLNNGNPYTAAIIKDAIIPEFLLLRGNYYPHPSSVIDECVVMVTHFIWCWLTVILRGIQPVDCLPVFWRWRSQHKLVALARQLN